MFFEPFEDDKQVIEIVLKDAEVNRQITNDEKKSRCMQLIKIWLINVSKDTITTRALMMLNIFRLDRVTLRLTKKSLLRIDC